ncbi:hypothetical protein QM012_008225 [Aureobasidium pullulans]|uniref:PLAC8-domain-containing protein n=1 Tax=Aureobasidium pullulans TaxID=5580 RepID=A0ABR0TIU1_AURPU
MPKTKQSKKATPKQRQPPYSTPSRPTSDPRSTAAAPSIPGARIFPAPPGLNVTHLLTPKEQRQSFLEFIRDQQNGTNRPCDVDEGRTPGGVHPPDHRGHDQDASDVPEMGVSVRRGTGAGEKIVGEDDIDHNWIGSATLSSRKKNDREHINSHINENKPELLIAPGRSIPPEQSPSPPEEHPQPQHEPTSEPLTEDEIWLEKLRPVQRYNSETPWPVSFHEQPSPTPEWHAECPEGYEPSALTGYPRRRQNPTYIPAAHDPDLVLHECGHYCVDLRELDEWDQCCMGKCNGCEICRPGL